MEPATIKVIPFPQANDFGKVYKLITIDEEKHLRNNQYLSQLLGITDRQINYYLTACSFLNIIDTKRNFTEFGKHLRNVGIDMRIILICSKITSKPVFSEAFFHYFIFSEKLKSEDIAELIVFHFGEKMEKVAIRRSSTVSNWIDWVIKQRNVI